MRFSSVLLQSALWLGLVPASLAANAWLAVAACGRPQDWLGWSVLVLFVLAVTWQACTAWRYLHGFTIARLGASAKSALERSSETIAAKASGLSRTVILVAIREEDPIAVFAALRVMVRSLRRLGGDGSDVDLFVFSTSREGAISAVEEHEFNRIRAWARLEGPGLPRIRYKRHVGEEGGSIAAFCAEYGRDYDFLVPLQAGDLMTGATLRRLVRLMEENARIGLIRIVPHAIGGDSLLARIRHFALRLDTPLMLRSLSYRNTDACWGEHAILRFAALDDEARLCRSVWEARLLPQMGGSWKMLRTDDAGRSGTLEASPPRAGRSYGITGFLEDAADPIRVAFLALGTVQAVKTGELGLLGVGLTGMTPAACILATLVLTVLVLPRLLSLAEVLVQPERRAAFGGTGRIIESTVLAQAAALLLWPEAAISATKTVLARLLGRAPSPDVRIRAISRRPPSWREAFRLRAEAVLAGVAFAILLVIAKNPALALVMAPFALALLASPAMLLIGQSNLGARARANGLFLTQDDTAPAPELAEFDHFRLPAKVARSRAANRTRLRAKLTTTGAKRIRSQPRGSAGAALAP